MKNPNASNVQEENAGLIQKIYADTDDAITQSSILNLKTQDKTDIPEVSLINVPNKQNTASRTNAHFENLIEDIEEEENLSIQEKEVELIKKSLEKHNGKRKDAAKELGISERTLYRKIKQYNLQ